MQLTNEAKRDIFDFVMKLIANISDKGYQNRVWIRGEGPECDSFVETCCHFFSDGIAMIQNYKEFGITYELYQLLKKFQDIFQTFSNENDFPELFIDTPEWTKITQMAEEVLKAFNYQKKPYEH